METTENINVLIWLAKLNLLKFNPDDEEPRQKVDKKVNSCQANK